MCLFRYLKLIAAAAHIRYMLYIVNSVGLFPSDIFW